MMSSSEHRSTAKALLVQVPLQQQEHHALLSTGLGNGGGGHADGDVALLYSAMRAFASSSSSPMYKYCSAAMSHSHKTPQGAFDRQMAALSTSCT